jgi:uncharacterized protein YndB with AHSA1/START domain
MDTEQMVAITRVLDAPRELVFKAWSDPEQLKRWFAPQGCSLAYVQMDFRQGGVLHQCIRTPMGDCWAKGFYREIVVPERIVYTLAFADEQGNLVDTSPVGKDPEWPMETTVTVTFAETNGKTTITLHQTVAESIAKRTGAYPSWLQMLDRLAEDLATIGTLVYVP